MAISSAKNLTVLSVLRYFLYLVEIGEAWISFVAGLPYLALIDDINVSWFILWHADTMSGELELALAHHL